MPSLVGQFKGSILLLLAFLLCMCVPVSSQRQSRPSIGMGRAISGFDDVQRYGADGSDSLDDTVALQAAVDAGSAHLPCGTYLINSRINITKSARIYGDGPCSIIQLQYAGIAILVQGLAVDWFAIHDLTIDGSHFGQHNAGLLQVNNGRMQVERVQFLNAGFERNPWSSGFACSWNGQGLQTTGLLRDCVAYGCSKAGIYVSVMCKDVVVDHCYSANNGMTGFSIVGQYTKVVNCTAENNGASGIFLSSMMWFTECVGPWNSIISNNILINNGTGVDQAAGIMTANAYGEEGSFGHILIQGNQCHDNQYGIIVQNMRNVSVLNNVCSYSRILPLLFQNAPDYLEANNLCR